MTARIPKEEYLRRDFDYTRLTKQELRAIMSEHNVDDIPPVTALKSTILEAYKTNIHDKIESLQESSSSNFSAENIFQEPVKPNDNVEIVIPVKRTNKVSSDYDTSASFVNASNISFMSQSFTERNTFNTEENESKIKTQKQTKNKKRKFMWIIWGLILISFGFYLKFYCPYCTGKEAFCIPPPRYSTVVNGKLLCEKGFHIVRGVIDYCVPDITEKEGRKKKVEDIIELLEKLKGYSEYGFSNEGAVKLSDLSDDPEVINLLCGTGRVVCRSGLIQAVKGRIGVRLFLKFYILKAVRVVIPLVLLFFVFRILRWRRAKRLVREKVASENAVKAAEILSRQLTYAAKSHLFLPHVREDKLRDSLHLTEDQWKITRTALLKNSNVNTKKDEEGRTLWEWTGPIITEGY